MILLDELAGLRQAEVHCVDYVGLAERAAALGGVDALIVDCPYSSKTHKCHDDGVKQMNPGVPWVRGNGRTEAKRERRDIAYAHWSKADVVEFVRVWAPLVRGWIVSLTDDVLFPVWREALRRSGRTVFQDVPLVVWGMTVRLAGDGPSSWAIHACVARPKSLHRWGTLPGAYAVPSRRQPVVGGKPFELMRALVRDYSRAGDLVCDPCAGGGTTLVAALAEGRRALGGDVDMERAGMAARWCQGLAPVPENKRQAELWGPGTAVTANQEGTCDASED